MIVSFPGTCWTFEVVNDISKGMPFGVAHLVASEMTLDAPIDLKVSDMLLIDLRAKSLEVVQREGIAIWRAGWLN